MKNIVTLLFIYNSIIANAQIAIGKTDITSGSNVSLEFYDQADNDKGFILPWVSTVVDNPLVYNSITGAGYNGMLTPIVDGTLILDLSDKHVKYRKSGGWTSLTGELKYPITVRTDNTDVIITTPTIIDTTLQDNQRESNNSKVAIGVNADTDTTNGILVLTDIDRAMVLPKVESPHLTIKNPAAGMIAYDTAKKQLAVFNGTVWSFWKP